VILDLLAVLTPAFTPTAPPLCPQL
jgi:hypothetical protein